MYGSVQQIYYSGFPPSIVTHPQPTSRVQGVGKDLLGGSDIQFYLPCFQSPWKSCEEQKACVFVAFWNRPFQFLSLHCKFRQGSCLVSVASVGLFVHYSGSQACSTMICPAGILPLPPVANVGLNAVLHVHHYWAEERRKESPAGLFHQCRFC